MKPDCSIEGNSPAAVMTAPRWMWFFSRPLNNTPMLSPAFASSRCLRNISIASTVALRVPSIRTVSPVRSVPLSTRPVATTPRLRMTNTSSTVILNMSGVRQPLVDEPRQPCRREARASSHELGLGADGKVDLMDCPAQPRRLDGLGDRVGDVLGGQPDAERLGRTCLDVVGHRGLDVQRPHGDHPDAVAAPFDVECLGDAADEELGRTVVGEF